MKETKMSFYQKGNSEIAGIGALIIFGLVAAGILWLFGFNFGMTNEGVVKYDDCRQVITIKSDSWQRYFHSFTCNTYKTKSGVVMSGECVSIKNDSSLFSSSHTCATAYVYEIEPPTNCKNNVKDGIAYPYLGYDDMCYTTPQ